MNNPLKSATEPQIDRYPPPARLALDTIGRLPARGIPTGLFHVMEHSVIERLAEAPRGAYRKDPHGVYIKMIQNVGQNIVGQYLAENPLTMGDHGYESGGGGPTTGGVAVLDGIAIDSPEAVCAHMESHYLPMLERKIADFNAEAVKESITKNMSLKRALLGGDILTVGYGHFAFPVMEYGRYGYEQYFLAYALYPELAERSFRLQADYAELHNAAAMACYLENGYPLFQRLDFDMADSRSTLASIQSLERLWYPHFLRSVAPVARAGFKLIWHCDGYLLDLFPYLLEAGIVGFQGFQYECGMDYEKICGMRTRDGDGLIIVAGVSVTKTLPFGTPRDVAAEMKYLVDHGPKTGLFLGVSSSCLPGTPWENIKAMVEGFRYYRENGRP